MPIGRLEEVFAEAIEIEGRVERRRFLDQVCAGDSKMLEQLLGLIRAHEHAGDFMDETTAWDQQEEDLPAEAIGPYTLVDRLGSGGFGVVYRALQVEPVRREVALKVIKPGMDTREVIARFNAERQALAMMDHPAIARVLDAGSTAKGHPYFVMELFEGEPITAFCDNRRSDIRQRLSLFAEVCEAVQHAHQKGIIHRDLKPSNILVADSSGAPAVKVIDFGVAKAIRESLTEQTLITLQGRLLGTPRYMSPEQFGESTGIDTRSDVYSLGVVLYELLTGTTPLHREHLCGYSPQQIRLALLNESFDVPSQRIRELGSAPGQHASAGHGDSRRFASLVKGDLDWLVMKALDREPERRYPTASALADDVRRYLKHEPVEAGPPTRLYRLSKFARRHRTALAMNLLVVASLLGGTALASWNSWRAEGAERLAERRLVAVEKEQQKTRDALALAEAAESEQRRLRRLAEQRAQRLRSLVYAADIRLAGQAYNEGDIRTLVDTLERQRPDAGQKDLRGFEWWLLWNQARIKPTLITQDRSGACLARFTPDGRFLVTGHYDGKLHLWDAETLEHVDVLAGHESFANGMDLDVQSNTLASAGDDHRIRLWDLDSGKEIANAAADSGHVHRVFFWDQGRKLVSAGEEPEVKIWDRSPLEVSQRYGGFHAAEHYGVKYRLDISPDRRRIVAADQYQTARVYDLESGEVVFSLDLGGGGQFIRCLGYSPDGRWIAGGRYKHEVTLWNAETGKVVDRFYGHLDDIQDVAFHPDGQLLATSDKSGIVRTWQLPRGDRQATDNSYFYRDWPPYFVAHDDRVYSLDFSPDGEMLVTACRDGTVRRWKGQRMPRLAIGESSPRPQTAWIDDALLAVNRDDHLVFWKVGDGEQPSIRKLSDSMSEQPIESLCASPDRRWLATGHFDGTVRIWNVATGEVERTLREHEGPVLSLVFATDAGTLITVGDDGLLLRWNVTDGSSTLMQKFPYRCKSVAASPSGTWVAAAVENDIYLFHLDGRVPAKRLRGHLNAVDHLAFSPDGKYLASGSHDRTVRLWDVRSGVQQHIIHAHRSKIEAIAFSPDGRTIASGDRTGNVSFNQAETGRLLCSVNLLQRWKDLDVSRKNPWISDLRFSPDGTRLSAGLFRIGYLVLRGPADTSP